MKEKYFDGFSDRLSVASQFEVGEGHRWESSTFIPRKDFPSERQILFASYASEGYEGSAFVLFEKKGQLFEVHGSHCSCNGLEGQWEPSETDWPSLGLRLNSGSIYGVAPEGQGPLRKLIERRIKRALARASACPTK